MGSRTGASNQPWGNHVPCQGVSVLICKMMKPDEELFKAPSSDNILGFYMKGKEEAEWGKERGAEEQLFWL